MEDYDSSPALSPHIGQMSKPISPDVQKERSPTVLRAGHGPSPVEGKLPHSPVTTGRLRRSFSFKKLLQSPDQSPSNADERLAGSSPGSLTLKRPLGPVFEDENSCDSGYASLPTEGLQPKRSRFKDKEDNLVDSWFSGLEVGPSPSPPLSFRSNTSSLDLDGFPLETISELPEEEGIEGSPSAPAGFTSLLSNTILVSQPSFSSTPTLRRSVSQTPAGEFKKPSAPVRQAGPITRSMLRSQNENRKRLVELKEDQPDVLPDGSR